jgi:hypothetical protein
MASSTLQEILDDMGHEATASLIELAVSQNRTVTSWPSAAVIQPIAMRPAATSCWIPPPFRVDAMRPAEPASSRAHISASPARS